MLLASGYIAGGALAGIIIALMSGLPSLVGFSNRLTEWATAHNPFFAGPHAQAAPPVQRRGVDRRQIRLARIEIHRHQLGRTTADNFVKPDLVQQYVVGAGAEAQCRRAARIDGRDRAAA